MNREELPAEQGYHMPAEWHPHAATWLAWPKDPLTWPDRVPQVEEIFLRMMKELAPNETVNLLVDDAATEAAVRRRCTFAGAENIRFHRIRTVDSWIRDYGPNFLLQKVVGADLRVRPFAAEGPRESEVNPRLTSDDEAESGVDRGVKPRHEKQLRSGAATEGRPYNLVGLAYNDWIFNAWGNKYEVLKKDNAIPARLESLLGVPRFEPSMVLEGGAIDINGAGVVMTTEQCLLNPNRNPHLNRQEIEQHLKDYLGVQKVIWLGEGIVGDDTDGHIDDIARFVSQTTVVCAVEENPADANYKLLQDNLARLRAATDVKGRNFDIVTLPMPGIVEASRDTSERELDRLPASYANFYIANGVVLVPIFGRSNDGRALEIIQRLFPDRRAVGINCEPLVWGMGTIHCVTQQQPYPQISQIK